MANRMDLDKILREILGTGNVYFQPPATIKMNYPAIVYSRSSISNNMADNDVYLQSRIYQVIVIDKNPDSKIVDEMSTRPSFRFSNHYVADGLNHDVFTVFI